MLRSVQVTYKPAFRVVKSRRLVGWVGRGGLFVGVEGKL